MKKTPLFLLAFACAFVIFACSKGSNNYSLTDHTAGMVTARLWSGSIYGYTKGDTLLTPTDTVLTEWPKVYGRTIADTSFYITKLNGFAVYMLGATTEYRSTDVSAKIKRFDSVVTGTLDAVVLYFYEKDSLSFVFHRVTGYNSTANEYYQSNIILHTK